MAIRNNKNIGNGAYHFSRLYRYFNKYLAFKCNFLVRYKYSLI